MSGLPLRSQVRVRWALAAVSGVVVGVTVAPILGAAAALLAGWATLALVSTTWTLCEVWPMSAAETEKHAKVEDPGRRLTRLIALFGSVVSLGAVVLVAAQAKQAEGAESVVLAGLALFSVVASWFMIQADYMLHYAKVFYGGEQQGLSFNQDDPPEYTDFAYFSVGLGMAYQAGDTDVKSNVIRRIVIGQTLIGYLFGTGIIATVLSLITDLGSG